MVRDRGVDRKALAVSLLLSVLLHLLVLNIDFTVESRHFLTDRERDHVRPSPDVIRVFELALPQEQPPATDVEVDMIEPSIAVAPPPIEFEEDQPRGGETADPSPPPPVGPPLGPRMTDPRLWGRPTSILEPQSLTGELLLRSRVDSLNRESVGVRLPSAGDMSVWTTRDADGNRWGLSPGQIHFGGVTLPLCGGDFDASNCGFGVPPSFRGEYRNQLRALLEIRRQGDRADLEERARAIRIRLDAARDSIPPS